jgi:hypothetical protein
MHDLTRLHRLLSFPILVFHDRLAAHLWHDCGVRQNDCEMKLPNLHSHKQSDEPNWKDEVVFDEARGLAVLRLEQCVADMRMPPRRETREDAEHFAKSLFRFS